MKEFMARKNIIMKLYQNWLKTEPYQNLFAPLNIHNSWKSSLMCSQEFQGN